MTPEPRDPTTTASRHAPLANQPGARRGGSGLLALALAAALATPAQAADQLPLWELGLGAGVLSLPHYRGSDQRHTWLLPVPYAVYRGAIFKADREGARAVLLDSDRVELEFSVAASAPTRSQDNTARAGMADLSPTLEFGPKLNSTLARGPGWQVDLRVPLRAAIAVRRHPGLVGWASNPHINLDVDGPGTWRFGVLGGPVFGDRRLHATTYDVPAAQATADRPAYRAPGGYGGLTLVAGVSQRTGNLWTGIFVKVDSLAGAAFANSPLVRQRHNWSAGVAMSWTFARSATLVDAQP